jgi:molybdate transport system substrate-binding protein
MNLRCRAVATAFSAVVCLTAMPTTTAAQVRVLISGGFRAPYNEVLPEFERSSGIKVMTAAGMSQGTSPTVILAQLRRGVQADVVILAREGLDEIIADHRITRGTDVDLAQTPLGAAVRSGAPKPDLRTLESFKASLLRANGVAFMPSTTGIYMTTKLFPRLGIADTIAKMSRPTGAAAVANGEAEITLQPVSELMHVAGIDFVGSVPSEVQYISVFSAAVVAGSKQVDASKRLIAFLASNNADSALTKSGMGRPANGRR